MKILKKKPNGVCDIYYYNKLTKSNIVINNVKQEDVQELIHSQTRNKKHRRFAKKHIVEIEDYQDEFGEIIDENSNFAEQMEKESYERFLRTQLYKGMKTLSPQEKKIIRMKFYEQKDNQEIAKLLNITINTVSQTKCRAMKKLREFVCKN